MVEQGPLVVTGWRVEKWKTVMVHHFKNWE